MGCARCTTRDCPWPSPTKAPTIYQADLDHALTRNQFARATLSISSLDEVEALSREICGYSEIGYERNKASWLGALPEQDLAPDTVLRQLDQFETEARARGITYTTFRRLTEALGFNRTPRPQSRERGRPQAREQ